MKTFLYEPFRKFFYSSLSVLMSAVVLNLGWVMSCNIFTASSPVLPRLTTAAQS